MTSISVFFPCYNDSKSIGKLIEDALFVLRKLTEDFEIIIIDDGSTDNSRDVLKKLSQKNNRLRLIFHEKNLGYGGALRSGFNAATKDLVFYTDGDGQYDVKELPILYSLMTPDVDFINGIKMSRKDPTYRIILGNFYSLIVRWIFWLPITDIDCDFRLIRNSVIKKINLTSSSGSICVELVKKAVLAGAKFRQVSVHHRQRSWGQSQFFVPRKILYTFWELGNLWIELMILNNIFKKVKSWK